MLSTVTLLGAITMLHTHRRLGNDTKILALTIRCLGVALWPLLARLIGCEGRCLIPGSLWLLSFEMVDALVLREPSSFVGLKLEKASVLGVVFALSSMCGNRPGSKYQPLFLYAVMGMFLTVLPTHDLPADHPSAVIIENVQRVLLGYCVATFVTAVALTHCASECGPPVESDGQNAYVTTSPNTRRAS